MIGALAFAIEHFVTVLTALRLRWAHAAIVSAPSAPILAAWAVLASTAAALALVASVLVVKVAPPATGAGVALVMASLNGVHVPKLLALRTAVVKVVGTVCSVASGLPVGPEGPLVHVGACVASLFTRRHRLARKVPESGRIRAWLDTFFNDRDGRDFLSAGVASGLAAAFGAPIGGVLFSLEEASTHWSHDTMWRYVVPSTTSPHSPQLSPHLFAHNRQVAAVLDAVHLHVIAAPIAGRRCLRGVRVLGEGARVDFVRRISRRRRPRGG